MEIGKAKIRAFFAEQKINVTEYKGHETQELRQGFGYHKTKDKSADRFESHCSDSLALACAVGTGESVEPGPFLAVDDSYYPGSKEGHIPTRSASEGSGAFPSLARRVNMQQHAELPCRGNIVPCADACMIRSRAREEFESRIRQGQWPVFGKGS